MASSVKRGTNLQVPDSSLGQPNFLKVSLVLKLKIQTLYLKFKLISYIILSLTQIKIDNVRNELKCAIAMENIYFETRTNTTYHSNGRSFIGYGNILNFDQSEVYLR